MCLALGIYFNKLSMIIAMAGILTGGLVKWEAILYYKEATSGIF